MQQAYESQFLLNSMMNGSVKRKIRSTECTEPKKLDSIN